MNVLAIDQGTSSTKAIVAGPNGDILGVGNAAVDPVVVGDGAVEQDPQELLDSILVAGRKAVAAAGVPVEAVGIANQGETVLRWNRRTGRTSGPAISWQDRRAVEVTRGLQRDEERLVELTGLPLDPYFAAPKMAWLGQQADGGIGDGEVITTVDAWLNHQLTGAFVTDAATASRTMLLDLKTTRWSEEGCELFGLDPEAQPEVVDCAAAVGETDAFGGTRPVTGLVVDQQAALFAESCFEPGEAKCTYGTGAFILATAGDEAPISGSRLAVCVAWRLGGRNHVLPRRSGLHRGVRRHLVGEARPDLAAFRSGLRSRPRPGRRHVRAGSRRARGALLGSGGSRRLDGVVASERPGRPRRRGHLGDRRPGGLARGRCRRRSGSAASASARRRRADAINGADAGASRSAPGAGGMLSITGCHRARCGGVRASGRRRGNDTRRCGR
jgi:FGGY family of carbohydrate kinases, N-terminal domain